MIVYPYGDVVAAVILKVGGRWYVCSEAKITLHPHGTYQYTTQTLEFLVMDSIHEYTTISYDDNYIEMIGFKREITLEYI